jgi:hypothetical protein
MTDSKSLLKKLEEGKLIIPFACVTSNGEWHEKGEMGWFAIVTNEKKDIDWNTEFKNILLHHPDHYVVAVDCHI